VADSKIAAMLLKPFKIRDLTEYDAGALGQAASRYGQDRTRALLRGWFGEDRPAWDRGTGQAEWAARSLPGICAGLHGTGRGEAARQLLDRALGTDPAGYRNGARVVITRLRGPEARGGPQASCWRGQRPGGPIGRPPASAGRSLGTAGGGAGRRLRAPSGETVREQGPGVAAGGEADHVLQAERIRPGDTAPEGPARDRAAPGCRRGVHGRVRELRTRYAKRLSLMERFDKARLPRLE
jgi:hypothetical protein